jgi:hypothetical protein
MARFRLDDDAPTFNEEDEREEEEDDEEDEEEEVPEPDGRLRVIW